MIKYVEVFEVNVIVGMWFVIILIVYGVVEVLVYGIVVKLK